MIVKLWQTTKYHNGLKYSGRWLYVHRDLADKLVNVPEAIVYSSWRSPEEQYRLYREGKTQTLKSNHRRGTAVDVINWQEVQGKMRANNLINDIDWDQNHFALGGEREATKYAIVNRIHGVPTYIRPNNEEKPMTIQETKDIVESLYWSFGLRKPDAQGVDFWVNEKKNEPQTSRWMARIMEGLREEKTNQGIRYFDAKENRWRSEDDVCGRG